MNGAAGSLPLPIETTPPGMREVTFTSRDGLELYARDYGDPITPWLPVVCLAGLTRNSRDFHELALHLSTHRHRPRRVIAFDYRGRGRSAFDTDSAGYNLTTELTDVLDGMAALDIGRAVIIGTSRGGMLAMKMAQKRRVAIAAMVLNDIGPQLEPRGLARIKTYVGQTPLPDDWADAARIQQRLHSAQFPLWTDADWDAFARQTYRDENGVPVPDYDRTLGGTMAGLEFDQPIPSLWEEFTSLGAMPMLILRGANSDLLSAETVEKMQAINPRAEAIVVEDEGHPPRLQVPHLLARISAFITKLEGSTPAPEAIVPRKARPFSLDDLSDASGA